MPKCPECGHTEPNVLNWFTYPDQNDNRNINPPGSGQGSLALVVCPNCTAVLGGAGYAWNHDPY